MSSSQLAALIQLLLLDPASLGLPAVQVLRRCLRSLKQLANCHREHAAFFDSSDKHARRLPVTLWLRAAADIESSLS